MPTNVYINPSSAKQPSREESPSPYLFQNPFSLLTYGNVNYNTTPVLFSPTTIYYYATGMYSDGTPQDITSRADGVYRVTINAVETIPNIGEYVRFTIGAQIAEYISQGANYSHTLVFYIVLSYGDVRNISVETQTTSGVCDLFCHFEFLT
jgi:hypothetical protein